jgi:hypothetical protein
VRDALPRLMFSLTAAATFGWQTCREACLVCDYCPRSCHLGTPELGRSGRRTMHCVVAAPAHAFSAATKLLMGSAFQRWLPFPHPCHSHVLAWMQAEPCWLTARKLCLLDVNHQRCHCCRAAGQVMHR